MKNKCSLNFSHPAKGRWKEKTFHRSIFISSAFLFMRWTTEIGKRLSFARCYSRYASLVLRRAASWVLSGWTGEKSLLLQKNRPGYGAAGLHIVVWDRVFFRIAIVILVFTCDRGLTVALYHAGNFVVRLAVLRHETHPLTFAAGQVFCVVL